MPVKPPQTVGDLFARLDAFAEVEAQLDEKGILDDRFLAAFAGEKADLSRQIGESLAVASGQPPRFVTNGGKFYTYAPLADGSASYIEDEPVDAATVPVASTTDPVNPGPASS